LSAVPFFLQSQPTLYKVARQEMSPVAAPLASLLLFSGFALAQIFAPDCSLTWQWVCFTRRVIFFFWPLPQAAVDDSDLTSLLFSVVQHSRPKCVHSRSVLDVNV
jgi:hypothetical protein